ncbi:MAG: sigma-54 interaction domain-containing protein [Planctomycetota bacterium]
MIDFSTNARFAPWPVSTTKVLILDLGNPSISQRISEIIATCLRFDVHIVVGRDALSNIFNDFQPDQVIVVTCRGTSDLLSNIETLGAVPHILILCEEASLKTSSLQSLSRWDDFLALPFNDLEIVHRINRCLGEQDIEGSEAVKQKILMKISSDHVIGRDPAFMEVIFKVQQIATCDITVLLQGETGVGKEVVARQIHYQSARTDKPFIPVNCGAIPPTLLENEFFGHWQGAYTDARVRQNGLVAEADHGTLFLDEIDALPLHAQSKLLRLLQEKRYRPLGSPKDMKSDIRIVASSNTDILQNVKQGSFREDLFYRLSVVTLRLPSLRERRSDVPLLANYFLKRYAKEYRCGHKRLSASALAKLMSYDWPGNIRELENIIQQATVLSQKPVIYSRNLNLQTSNNKYLCSFSEAKQNIIEKFEKEYVSQLLSLFGGNITKAARKAGKDRADFSRLVKKYQIDLLSLKERHQIASTVG